MQFKNAFKKNLRLLTAITTACWFCIAQSAFAGTIVGWGRMTSNSGDLVSNDFVSIATGRYHNIALKKDGSIVGWGDNWHGQATPPTGTDFVAIAAGGWHNLALRSDGSIAGWGRNDYGQGTPPAGNDFIAIAAGGRHSLVLKEDGSIVCWGKGYTDSVGGPSGQDNPGQATFPYGNDFVAVAAGYHHSLALRQDGSIVGWGKNDYGQATPPAGNYVAIAGGGWHSVALRADGNIVAWGRNDYGQATPPAGTYVAIAAGRWHGLALRQDGHTVAWGRNSHGQATPLAGSNFIAIGAGDYHSIGLKKDGSIVGSGDNLYGQAKSPEGEDFIAITANRSHSLALRENGRITGWGRNYEDQVPPVNSGFTTIAAGRLHSLALTEDGSIVAWGYNHEGQATPPVGNYFIAIAAGDYHSLGLTRQGTIAGWGSNYDGQATPPEGEDFVDVAAGWRHSLALKKDGSIVCWGMDSDGQATPPYGSNYIAIAAGGYHSLALTTDGYIVGWGYNDCEQAMPPEDGDFIAIAAGAYHSLGLKNDGRIVGWGDNYYGQASPPCGNGFVAIAAGHDYSLAIRESVILNSPPDCNANGPYTTECQGDVTSVPLDGTDSNDPDPGDTLTYFWTSDCPGATFDNPTSSTPTLSVDTTIIGCSIQCQVTLTVTDSDGESDTCSATVTIIDTIPPVITCPPDVTLECSANINPEVTGEATATDNCSQVTITYGDVCERGCAGTKTCLRTWTATDECGNSSTCEQTITVVDTTPPVINCPNDVTISGFGSMPVSFTVTATDNCDPNVQVSTDIPSGTLFEHGVTTVTATATDAYGNSSTCTFDVLVSCFAINELKMDAAHLRSKGITLLEVTSDQGVFVYKPDPGKEKLKKETIVDDGINGPVKINTSGSKPLEIGGVFGAYTITRVENIFETNLKKKKKGDDIDIKGTLNPAIPINLRTDEVTYVIDDGQGHTLDFTIPAGLFRPDGKLEDRKFKFKSPRGSYPEIDAKFDFSQCKFDLKVKRVYDLCDLAGRTLTVGLFAGTNLGEETVSLKLKGYHLEHKKKQQLDCCKP